MMKIMMIGDPLIQPTYLHEKSCAQRSMKVSG